MAPSATICPLNTASIQIQRFFPTIHDSTLMALHRLFKTTIDSLTQIICDKFAYKVCSSQFVYYAIEDEILKSRNAIICCTFLKICFSRLLGGFKELRCINCFKWKRVFYINFVEFLKDLNGGGCIHMMLMKKKLKRGGGGNEFKNSFLSSHFRSFQKILQTIKEKPLAVNWFSIQLYWN